ncbi:hypothetical protein EV715DRAFT_293551 [Schizophyllum commune]
MASDWGFNFRNGYACDSDSSDDDAPPKTETDLIRDFDLGSRDEGGVKYKPNPFSIAKINAAARGEPTTKQGGGKSGKTQGRGKPQAKKAGGGTIEHAFKTQAARPRNKAVKAPAVKQAPRSRPFQDPRIDRPVPTPPPAQAPSSRNTLATTNAATDPLTATDAATSAQTTASAKENILRMRPVNKLSPSRPASPSPVTSHPLGCSSASLVASPPPSSVSRKRPVNRAANDSIACSPSRLPSAYATAFGDADEEWSTIPASLRPGKRQKVNGVPFTAPFSIPALLGKAGAGASQVKAGNGSAAKARTGTGIIPRGGTRPPSDSRACDTVRKSGVSPGSRRRVITFLPPPLPSSVASKPVSHSSALKAESDDPDVLPSVNDGDEPRFQFSVDDVGRPRSSSPSYARSSSPTLVGANPRTPVHKDAAYSAYDMDATYDNGSVTIYDAIRSGYDDNFPVRDDNALHCASASHPSDGATCYDDAHLDAHTHYYGAQVRGHDVHAHHYDDYDDADDSMLANIDLEGVRLRFPALKARLRSRKKAVMTMWEKLNLPSCGEVYYDPEGKGGVGEIQVPSTCMGHVHRSLSPFAANRQI